MFGNSLFLSYAVNIHPKYSLDVDVKMDSHSVALLYRLVNVNKLLPFDELS